MTEESHKDKNAVRQDAPVTDEMDEVVEMKDSVCVGLFQTEILKGRVTRVPAHDTHVMVAPIRHPEVESGKACPLPPGLQVLHVYTTLTSDSKQVSIVVQNMTDSAIFLKRGVHVAHVVSVMLVPPEEAPSEQAEGAQVPREQMSVQEWQEKLMYKLNLDGLSEWSPHNAAIARELLLSYHDTFALKPDELGCSSAIKHEICLNDDKLFKECFRCIPLPLLEEVHASLRDMLEASAIQPSQSPWCNAVVLVRKKDGSLWFCVDFRQLNVQTKKDSYPLPRIQEALESMARAAHFSTMDFKSGFWQVPMAPELQQYIAFMVGNLGFYEFTRMPFRLCNTSVTSLHLMQNTLGELNLTYCIIYLDDLIIFGCIEEEHLKCLRVIFECFREFNLKLKPFKCSFFQTEIVYLAHYVAKEGIRLSEELCTPSWSFPCRKLIGTVYRNSSSSTNNNYVFPDLHLKIL